MKTLGYLSVFALFVLACAKEEKSPSLAAQPPSSQVLLFALDPIEYFGPEKTREVYLRGDQALWRFVSPGDKSGGQIIRKFGPVSYIDGLSFQGNDKYLSVFAKKADQILVRDRCGWRLSPDADLLQIVVAPLTMVSEPIAGQKEKLGPNDYRYTAVWGCYGPQELLKYVRD